MEENKLVPREQDDIVFDEQIYGVKIEKSKRRNRKKRKLKYIVILVCAACFLALAVQNFSGIKNFFSSLFISSSTDNSSSLSNNSSKENNDISFDNNEQHNNEKVNHEFYFIDTSAEKLTISNESDEEIEIDKLKYSLAKSKDIYEKYGEDAPIVLIINMSPMETYSDGIGYSSSSAFFDENKNVRLIGEQICTSLTSLGINAVHLTANFSWTSLLDYQDKYVRLVQSTLDENPSIAYVFDITRGIHFNSDMSMNREKTEINGVKVPTICFRCGSDKLSISEMQNRSISLAYELAMHINSTSPLLISTISVAPFNLNLRFSAPCIRIEIGTFACTYEEASLCADYLSLSLISFLE